MSLGSAIGTGIQCLEALEGFPLFSPKVQSIPKSLLEDVLEFFGSRQNAWVVRVEIWRHDSSR